MLRQKNSTAADLGLLTLRLTTGGLMAGHGAQKLFGVLGGYGPEGTGGWLESLGLRLGNRSKGNVSRKGAKAGTDHTRDFIPTALVERN